MSNRCQPFIAYWLMLVLLLTGCASQHIKPASTTSTAPAALDHALAARVDAILEKSMRDDQVPGLAVGIIHHRRVAYAKGFGVTQIGGDRAVTSQTVFQLGSDSKMMVGIAVMQLLQQGKIDLDAPVSHYLPYFRLADARYTAITLRYLLSHRAGLPWCADYDRCNFLDYASPEYDDGSLERHVRELATVRLENPPGAKMQYSDIGFEIVGDVIAKVSGQSFEDYVQQHIFVPMQMQHSSFMFDDVVTSVAAAPHVTNDNTKNTTLASYYPYSRLHAPSSHLFSNVDDMNRFALVQMDQGIHSPAAVLPASAYKTMWTPQIATNMQSKWEKHLGLGWFLGDYRGHPLVGHGGGDTGFACGVVMAPDDGIAVVVMENLESNAEDLAFEVMRLLLQAAAVETVAVH